MDQVKFEMAKKGERIHKLKNGLPSFLIVVCTVCKVAAESAESAAPAAHACTISRGEKGSWRFGADSGGDYGPLREILRDSDDQ